MRSSHWQARLGTGYAEALFSGAILPAPGYLQAILQDDVDSPQVVLREPEKQRRVQQLVSPRLRAGGSLLSWAVVPFAHERPLVLTPTGD